MTKIKCQSKPALRNGISKIVASSDFLNSTLVQGTMFWQQEDTHAAHEDQALAGSRESRDPGIFS